MTPETTTLEYAPPHFEMTVTLTDGTPAAMAIFGTTDGGIQFGFDRKVDQTLFGPQQIVEAMSHLNYLTKTLNNYVESRIAEAKAAIEKETQPELSLDAQPDSIPTEAETCDSETCCGGCDTGEVAPHAGQPE